MKVKSPFNQRRSKASTGRYVLIKPYTYTLDFLAANTPGLSEREERSVTILPHVYWRTLRRIEAFDPSAWHIRSDPQSRDNPSFHASIYIWSRMMRLPTLEKPSPSPPPRQPKISGPSPLSPLRQLHLIFPVYAPSNNPFSHMHADSCVDHVPLENSFVRADIILSLPADRRGVASQGDYIIRHMACTLRIASRAVCSGQSTWRSRHDKRAWWRNYAKVRY